MLPRYREFATLTGWRYERELFYRLLRFGGPAGSQVFLDVLVFNLFTRGRDVAASKLYAGPYTRVDGTELAYRTWGSHGGCRWM